MQWNKCKDLGLSSTEKEKLYLPVDARIDSTNVEDNNFKWIIDKDFGL